jgi:hypothetical protein
MHGPCSIVINASYEEAKLLTYSSVPADWHFSRLPLPCLSILVPPAVTIIGRFFCIFRFPSLFRCPNFSYAAGVRCFHPFSSFLLLPFVFLISFSTANFPSSSYSLAPFSPCYHGAAALAVLAIPCFCIILLSSFLLFPSLLNIS